MTGVEIMNTVSDAAMKLKDIPGARIAIPAAQYHQFRKLVSVMERVPLTGNGTNIKDGCRWIGVEVVPRDL